MWKEEDDNGSSFDSSDVNNVNKGGRPETGLKRTKRVTVYFSDKEKAAVDGFFDAHSPVSTGVFCRDVCVAMAADPKVAEKINALLYAKPLL